MPCSFIENLTQKKTFFSLPITAYLIFCDQSEKPNEIYGLKRFTIRALHGFRYYPHFSIISKHGGIDQYAFRICYIYTALIIHMSLFSIIYPLVLGRSSHMSI